MNGYGCVYDRLITLRSNIMDPIKRWNNLHTEPGWSFNPHAIGIWPNTLSFRPSYSPPLSKKKIDLVCVNNNYYNS